MEREEDLIFKTSLALSRRSGPGVVRESFLHYLLTCVRSTVDHSYKLIFIVTKDPSVYSRRC